MVPAARRDLSGISGRFPPVVTDDHEPRAAGHGTHQVLGQTTAPIVCVIDWTFSSSAAFVKGLTM
jgi:hypothetical protein